MIEFIQQTIVLSILAGIFKIMVVDVVKRVVSERMHNG